MRLLFAVFCFFPALLPAQFNTNTCIDSLLINNASCNGTQYQPICGCDGVSYWNECAATAKGLLSWTQGPCEIVDFGFGPSPMIDIGYIYFYTTQTTDVQIWIFDTYYREKLYFRYPSVYHSTILQDDIDVRGWGNGLYFVVVEAAGSYKVKRLLINQLP